MLQRSPNIRLVTRRQAFPRRHRARPYHQNGEQVAVIRALTGARLHLSMPIPAPTLSEAARMAGTHVGYIQAAIAVSGRRTKLSSRRFGRARSHCSKRPRKLNGGPS